MESFGINGGGDENSFSPGQSAVSYEAVAAGRETVGLEHNYTFSLLALKQAQSLGEVSSEEYKKHLNEFLDRSQDIDWSKLKVKDLVGYIGRLKQFDAYEKEQSSALGDTYSEEVALYGIACVIPGAVLGSLYFKNASVYESLRGILDGTELSKENIVLACLALCNIYGSSDAVRRLEAGRDPLLDRIRRSDFKAAADIYLLSRQPVPKDPESLGVFKKQLEEQSTDILLNQMGLPKSLVDNFLKTITPVDPSLETSRNGRVASGSMHIAGRLYDAWEVVHEVGVEKIAKVHERFGLVNIDYYSAEDINNLFNIITPGDNHNRYVSHLNNGDVAAVFIDAHESSTWAFRHSFLRFSRDTGRSLMFEIKQPSDLYRNMSILSSLGIKPSTLAICAHGSPGQTHFGEGRQGDFTAVTGGVSNDKSTESLINVTNTSFNRLVSDFMQASKGMDDGVDRRWRRSIILSSCYGDTAGGDPASMAEAILRQVDRADTDVFAAKDSVYSAQKSGKVVFGSDRDGDFVPDMSRLSIFEDKSSKEVERTPVDSVFEAFMNYIQT